MSEADERAHAFYNEEWGDKHIEVHSSCVIEECLNAAPRLDPDVFVIAGWIHDLGRKIDKDRHHEIGLEFLRRFLDRYPQYEPLADVLGDCILNHRTEGTPRTEHGRIFQKADKTALKNRRWLEYEALVSQD